MIATPIRTTKPAGVTLALTTDGQPANIAGLLSIRDQNPGCPTAWVIHEQHVTLQPTPTRTRIMSFSAAKLKDHLDWARGIGAVLPETLLIKNLENGHPIDPENGPRVLGAMLEYAGSLPRPQASYGLMKMDQYLFGRAITEAGVFPTGDADRKAAPVLAQDSLTLAEFYLSRAPGVGFSEVQQRGWLTAGLARAISYSSGRPFGAIAQPWYHNPGKEWHGKPLTDGDIALIRKVVSSNGGRLVLCAHVGPTSGGAAAEDIAKQVARWVTATA